MTPCSTSVRAGVTLTRCDRESIMHLFVDSVDRLTFAFKITVFTETGGKIKIIPYNGTAEFNMTGDLGGKLLHITVEELQTVRSAPFSVSDGTLP